MKKYLLSIGELSKLTGVHIKSLRYYDDIGILKPEYVNPETNYRYYSYPQISIVWAIQLCVELEIPLKDFTQFTDGKYLLYEKLLDQGKAMAHRKIHAIQKGLQQIEQTMEYVGIAKQYSTGTTYLRTTRSMNVLVRKAAEDSTRYYHSINALFDAAAHLGVEAGAEFGACIEYIEGVAQHYNYLEVQAEADESKSILHLPDGMYACIQGEGISTLDAPRLFPDVFRTSKRVWAVETEVIPPRYDIRVPILELRVIGLNK